MGVWFSKFCVFVSEHRVTAAAITFVCFAINHVSKKTSRSPTSSPKHNPFVETLQNATKIGNEFYLRVRHRCKCMLLRF